MKRAINDLRIATLAPGVVVVSWPESAAQLSPAEADVVALAGEGMSNPEIAAQRGTSVRTVANLLARAYRKLGVGSRVSASAALAMASAGKPTR